MADAEMICKQFAAVFNAQSRYENGVCSVSLHRSFNVTIQGKKSSSIVPAGITFESLDASGNAINLAEITLLEEEVPNFTWALTQNGLILSALHNHWIFTQPNLLYVHAQSIEPPLNFAKKLRNCFSYLSSAPVS
ncbi:DUF1259 domain-containing protein [Sporolactobacillus terrae]|uniref:DUF1259 domain-containing protein n=1 Tax=Sporolactobacillus terrae TaxID=269673 RepID=A0ABX5Q9D6_9BACL|nr:DUF1259 domain-containing protein [Sporolactobacillus terrae]QAA23219.1 DUF1259 domain-containing protein [Sporolactobacillus terrae]QAA26189.1 DUF1259 domain-containing protein [Sporolactobacillus terrae]UAK15286.1 DUF1259 domain-containing protein [Sporolactobacillus terrae]